MLEIKIKNKTYKNIFSNVVWKGDIKTSARSLEITCLKKDVEVDLGQEITFSVDNVKRFVGIVFRVSNNTADETMIITAYDNAIRLNKNNFIKNYFNDLPSNITKTILKELDITVGTLPRDATKCTYQAIDRSGYEILLIAYKIQASKDNKVYSIISRDNKISVVIQGNILEDTELSSKRNLRSATYSKDLEEMVNKVIIYQMDDNEDNDSEYETFSIKGNKSNVEDIKKYGLFQKIQEQDKSNSAYLEVSKILKGVNETSDLTCNGDVLLMSGYSVVVDTGTSLGLKGVFLIKEDTHIWTSNDYTTSVSLAFENVMNDVEIRTARKKYKEEEEEEF